MPLPDLEAWAIFAKVAERRSFTAAAEDLQLSKATVSKAVARLEARFQTQLFHRTSRRIALTATGQDLAVRAARILGEAEAAEDAARDEASSPRGVVRIATSISFGIVHLGPALPALLESCPGLSIELSLSDAAVDLVAEAIDIALRIGRLEDSTLRVRKLADVHACLVAAPAYLARYPAPQQPADLTAHRLFLYTNLARSDRLPLVHRSGRETVVRIAGPLAANNADVLMPALRAGAGMMMLPQFIVAADLATGALVRVLPDWAPPATALNLVTPPGGPRPARVRAVIDHLVEAFANPM
ncbi:LysR family transcriptional regulator [Sphingomonas sp. 1P06PA]|uniref:LysR family transcriptional regulator n=1 Tax=Sphingomonas sp. 1P06PA TaxID=554121 RepID=UPI0039A49A30